MSAHRTHRTAHLPHRTHRHRSTSPMTTSIEPMTAMTSAIRPPTIILGSAWQASERRRARLHAPRPVRAVGHDVEALLAARPLDRHVRVARGHREALRVDQEVLNQRFHLRVDAILRRRHDGRGIGRKRAGRRDARKRLPAESSRSPASRRSARGSDRTRRLRRRAARRTRTCRSRRTGTPCARRSSSPTARPMGPVRLRSDALLPREPADAARALQVDLVLRQQALVLVQLGRKAVRETA